MATTFTGLKLQGQLGKFGRTELSDIAGECSCHFKPSAIKPSVPPTISLCGATGWEGAVGD